VVWGDGPARSPGLPRRALAYSRGVAAASGPMGGTRSTASASRASPRGDGQHARRAHCWSDQFARKPWPARGSPAWVTEPQIAVHGVPLFGAPGPRHNEFVCGEMAIFVFGEGRTEPRKEGPRSWPLLTTTTPPSWVMPPVMGNAAHGVRSGPALVALPGPEVGRPRAHRVGGAGAHGGLHGRGLAGAVPARGTVPSRRGSAQTAGANGAPSSGQRRRPGGGLVGRRTNFYQLY
jgi:hypothetical protein